MAHWYEGRFLKYLIAIVLILTAIYLTYTILPLIGVFLGFTIKIIYPFLYALIFFYLLRPLVQLFSTRMPNVLAILLVFMLVGAFLVFMALFIYPVIIKQIELLKDIPLEVKDTDGDFFKLFINKSKEIVLNLLESINSIVVNNTLIVISTLTEFFTSLILTPFILFYLLKDSHTLYHKISEKTPSKYNIDVRNYLVDVDIALSHFISSRVIVSAIASLMLFVSFLIVGLDSALMLSLIAFIFYIIPTVGAFIAMIPPLLVGFSMSPLMGLIALAITTVVSMIEGFWLAPHIMGKTLYIHPLTLILILLIGGSLFGVIGVLFATPAYAVLKVTIKHLTKASRTYKIFQKEKLDKII